MKLATHLVKCLAFVCHVHLKKCLTSRKITQYPSIASTLIMSLLQTMLNPEPQVQHEEAQPTVFETDPVPMSAL